jgi:hypothetical protein
MTKLEQSTAQFAIGERIAQAPKDEKLSYYPECEERYL